MQEWQSMKTKKTNKCPACNDNVSDTYWCDWCLRMKIENKVVYLGDFHKFNYRDHDLVVDNDTLAYYTTPS